MQSDSPTGKCFRYVEPKELNGYGWVRAYKIVKPDTVASLYEVYSVNLYVNYDNTSEVRSASIVCGSEVLDASEIVRMERMEQDEYDNMRCKALQWITRKHQEMINVK